MANERDTFATTGGDAPVATSAVTPALAETVDVRGGVEPAPRTRIGRYKILRKLGAGGMGVVWEGSDPELDRGVAIKVLHGGGLQLSERLRREAQALARLAHPNVVTVYDVGIDDGELYIVMQLVVGVTLDVALRDERRAPGEIVELVVRAGRGLVAAHAAGIVHRDFKPTNVLVGTDQTVRVSDFGLSRASEEPSVADAGHLSGSLTASITSGKVVGTPAYMAPEQFLGGPVTHATDQFAFCVTLWEALCGERPFAGSDVASLREAVIAGRRREVPATTRMPRGVRAILERGLACQPAERFDSMAELLDALAPRRHGQKLAIAGGFAGLTAAAVITVAALSPSDPCKDVAQPADEVWNAVRQADVYSALVFRDADIAQHTVGLLAARTERWRAARLETCHARDDQPAGVIEARNQCLDRSLIDERAAIVMLSGTIDTQLGLRAREVAESGTDPVRCSQPGASAVTVHHSPWIAGLYDELARAEAELDAGRYRDVLGRRAALDREVAAAVDPTLDFKWNHILGLTLTSTDDFAGAKLATRRAAEAATTIGDDASAAIEWANLAELTAKSNAVTAADDLLAMARAAAARSHDDDKIAEVEITRGVVTSKHGAYKEAVTICRGVLDGLTRKGRAETRTALFAWDCIQHAQETANQMVAAVASARTALELTTKLYGASHPNTLQAREVLSTSLQENGDAVGAKELFDRAVVDYTAVYGAESVSMIELLRERAGSLSPAGTSTVPEAVTDIQRAVAIGEKILPANDPRKASLYEMLGYVEGALHHIEASNAAYARAIAAFEKLDDPMALARVLYDASEFPRMNGHCDIAIPMLKRASKVAADTGQKTRIQAASAAALGACLGGEKRWAEAEAMLRDAIVQQDALDDRMFGAQTRWELADELGKRGRHAEALEIAKAAAAELVGQPPPADAVRKQILEWKY